MTNVFRGEVERPTAMSETARRDGTDGDREPFAEGSVLTRLFGDHPKTCILAVLLSEPEHDLHKTEIAEEAGLARKTVYNHIDDLVDLGFVVETRVTGGNQMYRIDRDDPLAQELAAFEWALIDRVAATEPDPSGG
mgnify:CR=1 FL=1|jgi:biotin operon repressor